METSREKRNYTDPIDTLLRGFYYILTSDIVPPLNSHFQALGIRSAWQRSLAKMNLLY